MNISHKIWPLGKLPKNMQRPELDMLKNNGYKWDDPFDVVSLFEEKISNYANCKYAIAVDNCTDAIFLCLEYLKYSGKIDINEVIIFPSNCYVSIPMVAKKCGFNIGFVEKEWSGVYQLGDTAVWDSAGRFTQGMYIKQSYQCLSFQIKKRIIIIDSPSRKFGFHARTGSTGVIPQPHRYVLVIAILLLHRALMKWINLILSTKILPIPIL